MQSQPTSPDGRDVAQLAWNILAASAPTVRVCRRCGTTAAEAGQQNEPICNDHGLVSSHSYEDRPAAA